MSRRRCDHYFLEAGSPRIAKPSFKVKDKDFRPAHDGSCFVANVVISTVVARVFEVFYAQALVNSMFDSSNFQILEAELQVIVRSVSVNILTTVLALNRF